MARKGKLRVIFSREKRAEPYARYIERFSAASFARSARRQGRGARVFRAATAPRSVDSLLVTVFGVTKIASSFAIACLGREKAGYARLCCHSRGTQHDGPINRQEQGYCDIEYITV